MISLLSQNLKIQQSSDYNKKRNRLTDTENKLVVKVGRGWKVETIRRKTGSS